MNNNNKVKQELMEKNMIDIMAQSLKDIYSNKSSDEYKSHGDITIVSEYNNIDRMVSDLKTLQKFPKSDATDIKTLFLTLHRPVFKNTVNEYIHEPNERNTLFTAVYTVGYRVLVGELSRIYSSTVATDKGIVYRPDKISKRNNMNVFIRQFNSNLETRIDEYLRMNKTAPAVVEEAFTAGALTLATSSLEWFNKLLSPLKTATGVAANIVKSFFSINALLNKAITSDVDAFDDISSLYNATKTAYEEYVRIPEAQRSKRVESNYIKNLKKYEIRMDNLRAKVEHFNSSSISENNFMLSISLVSSCLLPIGCVLKTSTLDILSFGYNFKYSDNNKLFI